MVRCILDPVNRKPYFDSLDKFKELENSQLLNDCNTQLMFFLMNINADDLNKTMEFKWLVTNGLKDEKTGFWLRDSKFYDDDGRRVDPATGRFLKDDSGEFCDEFGFVIAKTEEVSITS